MNNHNEKRNQEIELFKQAINEALDRKFSKEIAEAEEVVEISENHKTNKTK